MSNIIQSCESNSNTIPADGSSAAIITVTVVNDDTPPLPQKDIDVSWVASGSGVVTPLSSTTDAEGKATTSLTANGKGTITVSGSIDDDPTGKSVKVTAEENTMAIIESITADPAYLPEDGSVKATVTATVTDGATPPVPQTGVSVTWTVTGKGNAVPVTSITDDNGKATTQLTASGAGLITVKATTKDDSTGKNTNLYASRALAAPEVLNANDADNFTLNKYDIAIGVDAIIPFYDGAEAGHIITFHWGEHEIQVSIQQPLTDLPKHIFINDEMPPNVLDDGTYQVYYDVRNKAGNISTSSGLTITVDQGGETVPTLPAPTVPASDDGYINIADALSGVVVTFSYDDMEEGDLVNLYWAAFDNEDRSLKSASSTFQVAIATGEKTHDLQIDSSLFFPNDGIGYEGYVNAFYTVQKAGSVGQTLALSFTKLCRVDTLNP